METLAPPRGRCGLPYRRGQQLPSRRQVDPFSRPSKIRCPGYIDLRNPFAMSPRPRSLTALPVFNEASHVCRVLDEVVRFADDVLVVDDGSTDGTSDLLASRTDIRVIRHTENRGYGAALRSAFCHAMRNDYDVVVTIDCDGQHEPQRIQSLISSFEGRSAAVDIISGSRYLETFQQDTQPAPADRRRINQTITAELNERFGLGLTDAFCGFKAYRVEALHKLALKEDGYAMPLELWVQAATAGLAIREVAVPLIYLDEKRSFGGALDEADHRLAHYREVIDRAEQRAAERRMRQAAPMEMC